jgi:hypothetical protein
MNEAPSTTHIVSAFDVPVGPIPLSMCQSVHTAMCEAREKILRDLAEARRTRAGFPMQPRPDLDRRVDWHLERLYYVTDVVDRIEEKVVDGSLPLDIGTWEIALGWKIERLAKADFRGALPFLQFTAGGAVLDGLGDRNEFDPSWQAAIRRDGDSMWEECGLDDADATTLTDWISDMHAHNARLAKGGGA